MPALFKSELQANKKRGGQNIWLLAFGSGCIAWTLRNFAIESTSVALVSSDFLAVVADTFDWKESVACAVENGRNVKLVENNNIGFRRRSAGVIDDDSRPRDEILTKNLF